MANSFGSDILIQSPDPAAAAQFYVEQLGFSVTAVTADLISLEGAAVNLYIERGPALGPILEVMVADVEAAKRRLTAAGCRVIKDEPDFPRCYIQDRHGLIYNLRPLAAG